jgi:surface protein
MGCELRQKYGEHLRCFQIFFYGDLSKWNLSCVTNMYGMFADAKSFNVDLSQWDVSSVTNMGYMFAYAISFNGDLSKWDVSSITTIGVY